MATARAAKARHHTMILSNVSTYSVEEVAKTLGTPPWQQLYMPLKWDETERMVKRIEDAGCPVRPAKNRLPITEYWLLVTDY